VGVADMTFGLVVHSLLICPFTHLGTFSQRHSRIMAAVPVSFVFLCLALANFCIADQNTKHIFDLWDSVSINIASGSCQNQPRNPWKTTTKDQLLTESMCGTELYINIALQANVKKPGQNLNWFHFTI